ncbi:MAG: type II secretion system minor pseudopilin GspI [Steroidobacteraceae bacterium]
MRSLRGFTLLEVLVALIIVALGMGAALKALTSAADSTSRLREKTFAAWIGFNQLATERLGTGSRTTGAQEAEIDYAGSRWHWLQTIEDMEVPGLKRITVRVRHSNQKDKGDTDSDKSHDSTSSTSAANEDWLATVVGFRGDSLEYPQSELAGWDDAANSQQNPSPTPIPGQPPIQPNVPPTTP